MNYASPEKLSQLATANHRLGRSLLTKMKVLKERLDNFTVVDTHGEPVGDVRNLVLNQRQLSLVIVQPDVHRHWRFVLLGSHLVQQVSLRDRVVFVHTTQADMSYLLDHQSTTLPANISNDASAQAKLIAPVSQLPAPLITDRKHRLEPANRTTPLPEWLAAQSASPPHESAKKPQLMDFPATPKMFASAVDTSAPRSSNPNETRVALAV